MAHESRTVRRGATARGPLRTLLLLLTLVAGAWAASLLLASPAGAADLRGGLGDLGGDLAGDTVGGLVEDVVRAPAAVTRAAPAPRPAAAPAPEPEPAPAPRPAAEPEPAPAAAPPARQATQRPVTTVVGKAVAPVRAAVREPVRGLTDAVRTTTQQARETVVDPTLSGAGALVRDTKATARELLSATGVSEVLAPLAPTLLDPVDEVVAPVAQLASGPMAAAAGAAADPSHRPDTSSPVDLVARTTSFGADADAAVATAPLGGSSAAAYARPADSGDAGGQTASGQVPDVPSPTPDSAASPTSGGGSGTAQPCVASTPWSLTPTTGSAVRGTSSAPLPDPGGRPGCTPD